MAKKILTRLRCPDHLHKIPAFCDTLSQGRLGIVLMLIGAVAVSPLLSSCKKKERLTTPSYSFRISPSAVTLVNGASQVFTVSAQAPSGSIEVSPEWIVSASSLGALSPTIGNRVTFTASALGDVVLSAAFEGQTTTAQVAIVAYEAPSGGTAFDVYSDLGIPSGARLDTSNNFTLSEPSNTDYTPEGSKFLRSENFGPTPGSFFWNVFLADTRDMSSFAGGSLKFFIRLGRPLSGVEALRLNIEDDTNPAVSTLSTAWVNFDRTDTEWQEVTIPLAAVFAGLDETRIQIPFQLIAAAIASPGLTFDIDAVRWVQ